MNWKELIKDFKENGMCIYLVISEKDEPLYIGKTSNYNVRYEQHKANFKKLGITNIKINILEYTEDRNKEEYYINLFSSNGFKLHNKSKNNNSIKEFKPVNTNTHKQISITEELKLRMDKAIGSIGHKMTYGDFIEYLISFYEEMEERRIENDLLD